MVTGLLDCLSDSTFRIGIGVDERSGNTGPAGDGGDTDRSLLPAQPCDGVVDAGERGLGVAVPGRQCGGGAWCRSGGLGHA